ncbi:hypothetical protein GCK72_011800 [Caenorhabditis remanei]|uniref:G-protein coupled receptors family 1 profile domain-containing protein n=1 Tax=Caenorhabditis remanei TaxID=31234 RepID=A0A6A5H9N7_CAERE|nr:hypothetical protein GCK72_011800 [Caenorhabditis remanei]KAF1763534.1 hypothetical protein GCK72_011800 [Caenorhabditis remanei]
MDSSSLCLPESQLRLSGSNLEAFLYTVLFPPICLFGVVGNALTILVLVNNDFMSRANIFLTCLAVCDVSFLILIIPHSLANFDRFAFNYTFRYLYLPSKMHLIAFANWTSAVAIWLVVGVCFERVAGVRSPLHRLTTPSRGKLTTGLLTLLSCCAALTFYNHVSHHCFIKSFCNASQIMAVCLDVNLDVWPNNRTNISPPALRTYVAATRAANAALVVFLPMILLVVLNMMLLYYVKKRSFFMYASLGRVSARMRKSGDVALPFVGTLFRRHSDQILQQRTEHRVAVTVCAVVTSFTITQAPSAVVLTVNSLLKERLDAHWYHMTTITSFLVVIGKSLNFVVFCLSSSSFRRRLANTLRSKYGSRDEKRSHSINTTYTRCDSRDSRILSQKKSFQSI